KGELKNWYLKDTLYPLFIVLAIAGIFKYLQISYLPNIQLMQLAALLVSACIVYAMLVPGIRNFLFEKYKLLKAK
ncbi:MAG: hypothetical protein ABJA71_07100, partial [Ginsengibacter sp.]